MIKHLIRKIISDLRYGISSYGLYDLDYYFAKEFVKKLRLFKKHKYSYPPDLTEKQWDKALDQMIEGFEIYQTDYEGNKKLEKKVDLALDLLRKYFRDLWI